MPTKSWFQHISTAAALQAVLQSALLASGNGPYPASAAASDPEGTAPIHAAHDAAHDQGGPQDSTPATPARDWSAPILANLAKEYKASPDEVTWNRYFSYLRDMLVASDYAQGNPQEIIACNPSLNELHVRVSELGIKNMRLWSFPSISQSHVVIFVSPGKTTAIPLPLSIVMREGRIVPSAIAPPSAPAGTTRVVVKMKGKNGKLIKVVKTVKTSRPAHAAAPLHQAESAGEEAMPLAAFGKFLVLIGGDRQTNALWLKGYKLGEGPLAEAPELFNSLPLFFSANVTGKASFSGSDIVLTIQPPAGPQTAKEEAEKADVIIQANGKSVPVKAVPTAVAGYKVVLKYMGGKFALAGKLPDDAPLGVALAFAQNICAGKSDVAKAWLADPKLVSIPKYLGLIGRSTPPMRLVAMTGTSGARYRLVTAATDDLIIDVGRVTTPGKMKGQLAIKGLFVAPADPYAAKFIGTPVMPQETDPTPKEGDDADKATAGAAARPATASGAAAAAAKKNLKSGAGTKSAGSGKSKAGTKSGIKAAKAR